MRTIKFRAWNPELNKMSKPFSFGQILNFWDTNFKSLEHDKEIVMQFIGIHDKNRKEIYEGDILKTPSDDFCYVVFDDTGFAVKTYGSEAIDWEFSTFYKECEVIGNIHENPELLKTVSSKNKA